MRELLPEIEKTVLPFLEREGVELLELSAVGKGRTSVLRFTVWRKNGIGLDDMARLSRHIGDLLDEADLIRGKYTLEVSSPGLDRELKTSADFRRTEGEKVKIELTDGDTVTGLLLSVQERELVVVNGENQKKIPFSDINKGKIIIEF